MKNFKNLYLTTIALALIAPSVQAMGPRSIASKVLQKAQTIAQSKKSHALGLTVAAATATASGCLPAITSTLSMIDPFFGVGCAIGAGYMGSMTNVMTNCYTQKIIATLGIMVPYKAPSPIGNLINKAVLITATPSQIKNAINAHNTRWTLATQMDLDLNHKDMPGLLKNATPIVIATNTAIQSAVLFGGQTVVDGVFCGAGTVFTYGCYALYNKSQQQRTSQKLNATKSQICLDVAQKQIADNISEQNPKK